MPFFAKAGGQKSARAVQGTLSLTNQLRCTVQLDVPEFRKRNGVLNGGIYAAKTGGKSARILKESLNESEANNMALWKRGGKYWTDFSIDGDRFRLPLGTTDEREAKRLEKDKIKQAMEGTIGAKAM